MFSVLDSTATEQGIQCRFLIPHPLIGKLRDMHQVFFTKERR